MKYTLVILLLLMVTSLHASAAETEPEYYSFVLNSHPTVVDVTLQSARYTLDSKIATDLGFQPLTTTWGSATYAPIALMVWNSSDDTKNTRVFLQTLMHEKIKLMQVYGLANDDYNRLAVMAFGIYGNESKFGKSLKYSLKEQAQFLVTAYKELSGDDDGSNSRGGTQIKEIPKLIAQAYPEITPQSLKNVRNSAIATLGFLAATLENLRARRLHQLKFGVGPGSVNLSYMTSQNIYDYIPYVYSGQMTKILAGPNGRAGATVVNNGYIVSLKKNVAAVTVWEYTR